MTLSGTAVNKKDQQENDANQTTRRCTGWRRKGSN
jgi:hypothetical protein